MGGRVKRRRIIQGTWVARLAKCLTLDFGSGRDLDVMGSKPHWVPYWAWSLLGILSHAHPLHPFIAHLPKAYRCSLRACDYGVFTCKLLYRTAIAKKTTSKCNRLVIIETCDPCLLYNFRVHRIHISKALLSWAGSWDVEIALFL